MSAILVKILNFWQTGYMLCLPKIIRACLVGIETKHGAVVEGLVLHGFSVYSINSKQSDRDFVIGIAQAARRVTTWMPT